MQPSENRSNHSSVSTFLAPATACGRAERDAPVTTGEKRMSLGSGWVVAALFLVPLSSVSGQRTTRALSDPVLRPGDVLRITVWRHPEMSGEFVVAPDSTLGHPLYQVVKVAGAPLPVVKERLRGLLATYEQDVQLVIEPLFPVTVAGEVRVPNLYRLPPGTTFAQAIPPAGGPTAARSVDQGPRLRRDRR